MERELKGMCEKVELMNVDVEVELIDSRYSYKELDMREYSEELLSVREKIQAIVLSDVPILMSDRCIESKLISSL